MRVTRLDSGIQHLASVGLSHSYLAEEHGRRRCLHSKKTGKMRMKEREKQRLFVYVCACV